METLRTIINACPTSFGIMWQHGQHPKQARTLASFHHCLLEHLCYIEFEFFVYSYILTILIWSSRFSMLVLVSATMAGVEETNKLEWYTGIWLCRLRLVGSNGNPRPIIHFVSNFIHPNSPFNGPTRTCWSASSSNPTNTLVTARVTYQASPTILLWVVGCRCISIWPRYPTTCPTACCVLPSSFRAHIAATYCTCLLLNL